MKKKFVLKKKERKMEIWTLYVPRALKARIRAYAKKNNTTMSDVVRQVLEQTIA